MYKLALGILLSIFIAALLISPKQLVFADEFGTWSSAGTNNEARDSFASVKLSSGKVIVSGGRTTTYTRGVTEYNPVTNIWSNKVGMKDGRYDHTANVVRIADGSERALIVGGHGGPSGWPGAFLNTAELYNPSTNTWSYTANNMASPHAYHTSTVLNDGKVLIAGGLISGTDKTSAVDLYDPVVNNWSIAASMPEAKANHTATLLLDGRIFVIGGQITSNGSTTVTTSTAFYDPTTNFWSLGPNLNIARSSHETVLLPDGRIMVMGGVTIGGVVSYSTEIWSPVANNWIDGVPMNYRRNGHTASVLQNGKVLVIGGNGGLQGTNNAFLTSAEIYDPDTDKWHITDSMATPRRGHAAELLDNGSVLVANGINLNGFTNTAEIYTPAISTSTPSPTPSTSSGPTATPTATPTPSPTPTPTLTPSPTPSPTLLPTPTPEVLGEDTVAPFLDLPFDYQSLGKSFEQVAFNPESWFDHAYPLQNIACCVQNVLTYAGIERNLPYRSHAGYDYASGNGVEHGTPVLAAASGSAEFIPEAESGGLGNLIKIDHGNGYQTWYGHLDPIALIVDVEGVNVSVEKGQKIGETGFTGNVFPKNKYGAHIHFGVFKDENENDTFSDDYPFGLVDPLGWEGIQTDPWTEYGTTRHGAQSFNLFIDKIKPIEAIMPTSGGVITVQNIEVNVPQNAYPTTFTIKGNISSYESQDNLISAAPSFYLYAFNSLGQSLTNFFEPIKILYSYASSELSNVKENTLKLYYFNTSTNRWEALSSTVDSTNKTVSAKTTHFTHFALMGEISDSVSPITNAVIEGEQGQENWYHSPVSVSLLAEDNVGDSGVKDTIYSINGNEWFDYFAPLIFEDDGKYLLTYQSRDMVDNKESQKTIAFHIDKTFPITTASLSGTIGENDWYTSNVSLDLSAEDTGGIKKIEYSVDEGETYIEYTSPVLFTDEGSHELLYRSVDKAGNVEEAKYIAFSIDKTAPSTLVYTTGTAGSDTWYRSNVQISFNANDQTSGYKTSFYSLGNKNNFIEYIEPIFLTQEGEIKIFYYSVDQAGNTEELKEKIIHIDKTVPEAVIRYDLQKKDIIVEGIDASGNVNIMEEELRRKRKQIVISDQAGNTLILKDIERERGANDVLRILALSYNGVVTTLEADRFLVQYSVDKKGKVKRLDQLYSVRWGERIGLHYDPKKNKTTIMQDLIHGRGTKHRARTQVEGMKFLQLRTDKGAIKYTW